MPEAARSNRYKLAISIAILVILGLHVLVLFGKDTWRRTWPILVWGMYKDSRQPGPIVAQDRQMIGTTATGRRTVITADMVGLAPGAIMRLYSKQMLAGDSAAAQRLLNRLNRGRDDAFVELLLAGETYTVTQTGIAMTPIPVMTYRLNTSGSR